MFSCQHHHLLCSPQRECKFIKCVLPIFIMSLNSSAFLLIAVITSSIADNKSNELRSMAMCIAVGKVSLLDCDIFTWSLGLMISYAPFFLPKVSNDLLAITSLQFILKAVPAPEFIESSTN